MATEDSYFILSVNTEMIQAAIEAKQPLGDDGLEEAFDVGRRFLFLKVGYPFLIICRYWEKWMKL